jgi:hypothetical protein
MSITLAPEVEKKIEELASYVGMNANDYLASLFTNVPDPFTRRTKLDKSTTFAEIVAPIREDFAKSGETPEEAEAFIEKEIKAYRAEQRAKTS